MKFFLLIFLVCSFDILQSQTDMPAEIQSAYNYINCSPLTNKDTVLKKTVSILQNPSTLTSLPGEVKIGLQLIARCV